MRRVRPPEQLGCTDWARSKAPESPGVTFPAGARNAWSSGFPAFRRRLFWPKSKCCDYLYQEAEALLKNFPIKATISIYEDSDSEEEIEELICEN
uniref:Protein ripply2 n=1 Tax=Camelus bactrianus TaxID=9837 RepID=A0A9W3H9I6_CAMBA|nr:protein ripply2 [Camelus bactrianus]